MKNTNEKLAFKFHPGHYSSSNRKMTRSKLMFRYMTLIEILVVVVIMSILMTISLPAFTSMLKGVGVEAAGRNMTQALKMARIHAINNNKYVALLMPSKLGSAGRPDQNSSELTDLYYNRTFRFCYVTKRSGNDYNFRNWIPGEGWQFLTEGTMFLEMNTGKGVNVTSGALDPIEGTISKVYNVDYQEAGGVKITGVTDDDTTAAIVFKPSGKVAGLQRYLEIGEGAYSGNVQVITNRDPNAYVSIKVDQYTGRVSYGDE